MENHFAENLRRIRLERNLTQRQLAEIAGIDRSSLAAYESGKRIGNIDILICLADFLEVSIDELVR